MHLSPDEIIFWQYGFLKLNATIVYTWGLMLVLAVGSKLITRKLSTGLDRSRWQNLLEIVVTAHREADRGGRPAPPAKYLGFLGTLFLFVAAAEPLHHHSRLRAADRFALDHGGAGALRVRGRAAVRHRGQGLGGYLKSYMKPTVIMLPFNIISEISRTLALAVRLFGNMMSGDDDPRHPADHHALHLSDRHDRCSACSPAWCRPTSSASWPRSTSRPPRASPQAETPSRSHA